MNLLIRPLSAEDLDGVPALAAASDGPRWTRSDYEGILLAEPRTSPVDPLQRCGLVALSDGYLSGFARNQLVAARKPQPNWKEYLWTAPIAARALDRALVRACMAWAANTGATTIRLEVRASNAAALALYQRYGFSTSRASAALTTQYQSKTPCFLKPPYLYNSPRVSAHTWFVTDTSMVLASLRLAFWSSW